ncbi:MAG TPA: DNA starvation/stationary phase protection protein [Alphaproteobacteria bacterium]
MAEAHTKERTTAKARAPRVNDATRAVSEALARALANTYTLYLKTHNYHWNVTGPQFASLHTLFETQYTELAAAVDTIAERIRALGHVAPGSYSAFARLGEINEAPDQPPSAMDMVRDLAADNETLVRIAEDVNRIADEHGDVASGDLMIERMQVHAKAAWMLRAHLEG